MKLFKNIRGLAVIIGGMLKLSKNAKAIEGAKARGDYETERAEILNACQIWSTHIVEKLNVHINIIGEEKLPKSGPVVYIANHQSYADILTFLYCVKNHQVAFIAKDALQKIPIFGKWIERIRGIFMHREDARSSLMTINEGVQYLNDGFSLIIFPEGTRSHSSQMAEFKAGSFKLATKAKVPIVPVTLDGGYHMYEETGAILPGQTITFTVHDPIETAGMSRQEMADIHTQVEAIVRSALPQQQQQEQPQAPQSQQ